MKFRTGTPACLFCALAGFMVLITWQSRAGVFGEYWTSSQGFFSGPSITINVGDSVDIANFDSNDYLDLTGDDPNLFYADIPPESASSYYYVPITYNSPGTYTFSDQFNNTVTVTVNPVTPLSVAITAPTNNAVFSAPANFTITAAPSGGAPPYLNVNFYVGTNAPYTAYATFTYNVTNLMPGTYNVTAVAMDNNLNKATNSIQVTVSPLTVTNYILPVDCEAITSSGGLNGTYLDVSANYHGALEFAHFIPAQYTSIQVEINPYGLPLFSTSLTVYGFDGGNGTLVASNYSPATLIGTWNLPANLGYGQAATYDVTAFVKSTHGPYFGIVLAATGAGDLFSTPGKNYGLPPELYVVSLSPPLSARATGGNVIINWTTNNAAGFTLMSSPGFGPGSTWTPVTPAPTQIGNQWFVTNAISGGSRYYRFSGP